MMGAMTDRPGNAAKAAAPPPPPSLPLTGAPVVKGGPPGGLGGLWAAKVAPSLGGTMASGAHALASGSRLVVRMMKTLC